MIQTNVYPLLDRLTLVGLFFLKLITWEIGQSLPFLISTKIDSKLSKKNFFNTINLSLFS
jgi:hypothetical protein